jgi:Protein kinase domain
MTELLERLKSALDGRYTIDREIGSGGMATVYLARDARHDRQVAVKVVHAEITPSLAHERFLREIQIAAGLTHPHILPLYDSGEAAGRLFYVMPFVEGESLRERLEREGPLSVKATQQLAREVGSALSYAHERGIVHRDVKPENIMLSGGHAVVMDFGVAKALSDAGGTRLTKTGFATGTPQYMSPEQAAGEPVDGRSDEYALACVLYESLAGEPPFTGPTSAAVLARHSLDPVPSLRTVRSVVPPELEAAIEQGLAKLPVDRFETVEQFVEAVSGERPVAKRVAELPTMKRIPAWLAWTVTLVAVGTAAILAWTTFDVGRLIRSTPGVERVAIVDFDGVALAPELEYLTRAIPEFLSAALTGETGGAQAIDRRVVTRAWEQAVGASTDPIARYVSVAGAVGATHVITGQLISQPNGQVRAQASLMRGREMVLQSRPVVLPASEAIAVAESLGVQLLAASAGEIERLPGLVSSSTESVQEWLAATQAFRRGEWGAAVERYSGALDRDSTFALAAWGLMLSDSWFSGDTDSPAYLRGRRLAWEHRDRLPAADSAVFVAESQRNGYPESREGGEYANFEAYQRAVQKYPDSWIAWIRYGDYLWHEGGVYVNDGRGKAVAALLQAAQLDTLGNAEPFSHLGEYYAINGDTAAFSRLPLAYQGQTERISLSMMYPGRPINDEDWKLLDERYELPIHVLIFLQAAGAGMDEADRVAAILAARAAEGDGNSAYVVGNYEVNRGRPEQATPLLRNASVDRDECWRGACQEPEMWIEQALFADGDAAMAGRVADSLAAELNDLDPEDFESDDRAVRGSAFAGLRKLTWVSLWKLSHGDTTGVRSAIRLIRRPAELAPRFVGLHAGLLEAALAVQLDAPDAAARVAAADSAFVKGAPIRHQAAYLLVIADLYAQIGDTEAALNRYRREWVIWGEEPSHLLPARRLGRARMAAELGLRDEALSVYQQYLALRSNPEPALDTKVAEVRAEYEVYRAGS